MVDAQRVVGSGEEALDAVTEAGFQGRRVAITEERVPGVPVRPAGSADAAGTARITDYEPERVRLQVSSSGPALAVLGDNHYPGWKAEVDGRPADIERVDYLFRGVRVGAGLHTVEFRYEPLSWRIGWIVSLVAVIGLVAALAIGLRRRPRQSGARAPRAEA